MTVLHFPILYVAPDTTSRIGGAKIDVRDIEAHEAPVAIVSGNTPGMEIAYRWHDGGLWAPTRRPRGERNAIAPQEMTRAGEYRGTCVDPADMSPELRASAAWHGLVERARSTAMIAGELHSPTTGPILEFDGRGPEKKLVWRDPPHHSIYGYVQVDTYGYRDAALAHDMAAMASPGGYTTIGTAPDILMDVDDGYRSFDRAVVAACWCAISVTRKRTVDELGVAGTQGVLELRRLLGRQDSEYNGSSSRMAEMGRLPQQDVDIAALASAFTDIVPAIRPLSATWATTIFDKACARIEMAARDPENDEALALAFR